MTDYLLLEVYTHDVQFDASLGPVVQQDTTRTPYALAFQFLDYPLLLTYAHTGPSFGSGSVIRFFAGKSCVLQEEAEELQYVLEKVKDVRHAFKRHFHAHADSTEHLVSYFPLTLSLLGPSGMAPSRSPYMRRSSTSRHCLAQPCLHPAARLCSSPSQWRAVPRPRPPTAAPAVRAPGWPMQ